MFPRRSWITDGICDLEALSAELNAVIDEVSQLTDRDGVPAEQRKRALAALNEYVACLEGTAPTATDCHRVARLVIEYWPLDLEVGEHIVNLERRLRALFGQERQF